MALIELLSIGVSDSSGEAVANGYAYFTNSETGSVQTVYSDFEETEPVNNPVQLDAMGRAFVYSSVRLNIAISSSSYSHVTTYHNVGSNSTDYQAALVRTIAGTGLVIDDNDRLSLSVDGDSIEVHVGSIRVPPRAITRTKIVETGQVESDDIQLAVSDANEVDITGATVDIVSHGNPVLMATLPIVTGSSATTASRNSANQTVIHNIKRSSTSYLATIQSTNGTGTLHLPPFFVSGIDAPTAGSHTYQCRADANSQNFAVFYKLMALEF